MERELLVATLEPVAGGSKYDLYAVPGEAGSVAEGLVFYQALDLETGKVWALGIRPWQVAVLSRVDVAEYIGEKMAALVECVVAVADEAVIRRVLRQS